MSKSLDRGVAQQKERSNLRSSVAPKANARRRGTVWDSLSHLVRQCRSSVDIACTKGMGRMSEQNEAS